MQDLHRRTKRFALDLIRFYGSLGRGIETQVIGRQLLRSGTSPGAQYREAYRSRSDAEYISKMESALQELEETGYWLELLEEGRLVPPGATKTLRDEVEELTAIFVTSIRTAKLRRKRG